MTGREGGLALFAGWVLYRLLLRRPNLQIKGSLIVVTGASQGVGREICKQLTARGSDVIMVARSWGLLDATRLEIENRGWGGHAYVEACDCSDGGMQMRFLLISHFTTPLR
jgi:NAD(P)-dependent dehydrogenase (short-subunit alcohol dehydrogenase family)